MTDVVAMRGYPASGKSTFAKAWVAREPETRARLNRDDLRASMFAVTGVGTYLQERAVTIAQHTAAKQLLAAGISVVFDDTNLRLKYARETAILAKQAGARFTYIDMETPVDVCVRQDAARDRVVGEAVIRALAARFPRKSWQPIAAPEHTKADGPPVVPYVPDLSKPRAYIVDVDGTVALKGDRDIYDYTKVHLDTLIEPVADVVKRLDGVIIVMSGREDICIRETALWLGKHGIHPEKLLMRATGDKRRDSIVKTELFDQHVRDNYNVRGVFDDRLSVCRQWHALGLPLFRVGDPDADF